MSEYDDLIEEPLAREADEKGEFSEELTAMQAEQATSLPPLLKASDLLPAEEDPLASVPHEPPDDQTPPDEAVPAFIVRRNAFGPGSHSVKLANGEPVGVWLDRAHHEYTGSQVQALLLEMGLDEDLAGEFRQRRERRIEAEQLLHEHPAAQATMANEAVRLEQKQRVQAAFLAAHKKRQKEQA